MAGFLRREPVRLVRCLTSGLMVPADAEMVIEGYMEPGEMLQGGAFGNHTGFYSGAADVPVMHVSCVTRRREMIYPATVVGRPPMEDCYMAKAAGKLLLPLLRMQQPEITSINMPMEGIFHGCAIVALDKRDENHPREAVEALWKSGWLADSRLLVIVDGDTDVNDLSLVAWRILNVADWRRDLILDEAARENVPLGRLALDATRKKGSDGRVLEEIARGRSVTEMVERRWREYGI
jgi:4-hydroxy-3-polyprenylbenzoate decarboxylase